MKCVFDLRPAFDAGSDPVGGEAQWWAAATREPLRLGCLKADMGAQADRREFVEYSLKGMKFKASMLQKVAGLNGLSHGQALDVVAELCGFDSWFDARRCGKVLCEPVDLGDPIARRNVIDHVWHLAIGCWGLHEDDSGNPSAKNVLSTLLRSFKDRFRLDEGRALRMLTNMFVHTREQAKVLDAKAREAKLLSQEREQASQERKEALAFAQSSDGKLLEDRLRSAYVAKNVQELCDLVYDNDSKAAKLVSKKVLEGWIGEHKLSVVGELLGWCQGEDGAGKFSLAQCLMDSVACPPDRTALVSAVRLASEDCGDGYDMLQQARVAQELLSKVEASPLEEVQIKWVLSLRLFDAAAASGGDERQHMEALQLWVEVFEFERANMIGRSPRYSYEDGFGDWIELSHEDAPIDAKDRGIDGDIFAQLLRMSSREDRLVILDVIKKLDLQCLKQVVSKMKGGDRSDEDEEEVGALVTLQHALLSGDDRVKGYLLAHGNIFISAEWKNGRLKFTGDSGDVDWRMVVDSLCFGTRESGELLLGLLAD